MNQEISVNMQEVVPQEGEDYAEKMRQIRSGGLTLLENYQNDKINPASPMTEYINTLKVQYSKETMKWM